MLHLVRSSRLERLADALAQHLAAPASDPLAPEWVVAGGRPAERWLVPQIAQRLGVVAHVRVLSPSTLLETVVEAVLHRPSADVRRWRAERLAWPVLRALPTLLADDPTFGPVCDYLARGGRPAGAALDDARSVALARAVGACLARYQAAAPALVRRWDAGDVATAAPQDAWQPRLWAALAHEFGAPSLVALADEAAARLRAGERAVRLPARIAWLVQSAPLPLHLDMLGALSAAGVEFLVLLATPYADTPRDAGPPDHPLLASLGREPRATERMLRAALAASGVEVHETTLDDAPTAPALGDQAHTNRAPAAHGGAILGRLQRSVRDGALPPRAALDSSDRSLRVHACHGRMRQVEVLRDELLRAFDDLPGLEPRDVVVLTPDPEAFAPLVEAVFAPSAGLPTIPVRVADHVTTRERVADDVALRLLVLADARVDAASMMDLLTQPAVGAAFGIAADEYPRLRAWVRESGVRWGLDADDRVGPDAARARADRVADPALPAWDEHSWQFGMDRLVLGTALPGDGRTMYAGVLPFDEVEGEDAALLGRFAQAWAQAAGVIRSLRAPRPLAAWRDALLDGVAALVDEADPDVALATYGLGAALQAALDDAGESAATHVLALDGARLLLEHRLGDASLAGGFGVGAVSVGRLQAGRVVPARVVALLGLDADVFPHRAGQLGFDLLSREFGGQAPADTMGGSDTVLAGSADDDRARFLDAILAARERLVVTFAGRAPDTNAPLAPAVPVTELLDVVDAIATAGTSVPARRVVLCQHRLQPFSAEHFDPAAPVGHDPTWLAGARAMAGPKREPPPFVRLRPEADGGARAVTLDALVRFLANPAAGFLRHALEVSLEEESPLECREPAELDALGKHRVRERTLGALLGGRAPGDAAGEATDDALLAVLTAEGCLPPLALGRVAFDGPAGDARAVAAVVAALRQGAWEPDFALDVELDGWRVTGPIGSTWGGRLVLAEAGALTAKRRLAAWVRHLALCCVRPGASSVLVCRPKKRDKHVLELGPVPDAPRHLATLVGRYADGLRAPLPFFPEASYTYADRLRPGPKRPADPSDRALERAYDRFAPEFRRAPCEADDAAVRRAFGDGSALFHRPDGPFADLAAEIWNPVLAHATERTA